MARAGDKRGGSVVFRGSPCRCRAWLGRGAEKDLHGGLGQRAGILRKCHAAEG